MEAEPGQQGFFLEGVPPPVPFKRGKQDRYGAAVEGIADDGVAQGGKVHPDLMGAAGLGDRLQEAVVPRAPQQAETGAGFFSPVFIDDGQVPFAAIGNQGQIAVRFPPDRPALHDGEVPFCHPPAFEGAGKKAVGCSVLCEEHQPRRVPVNPVDHEDPAPFPPGGGSGGFRRSRRFRRWPRFPVPQRFFQQPVEPLPRFVPAVGPHGDSRRLVHRRDPAVFVYYGK